MLRRAIRERNILFLDQGNTATGRIAEAIAKHMAPPQTRIFSASTTPGKIPPQVLSVLEEIGVKVAASNANSLNDVPLDEIDLVITLSPEMKGQRPRLSPRAKIVHWAIPDATRASSGDQGQNAIYRHLRDEIDTRVAALFLDYWRNSNA